MTASLLLRAVPLVAFVDAALSNCPCLATFPAGVDPAAGVTIGGSEYAYPTTYGLGTCARHDQGLPPACDAAHDAIAPAWCADRWCYVDKDNCNLPTTSSSYFPGTALHYSYSTCGSTNTFTLWFDPDAAGSGEVSSGASGTHVLGDIVTVIHDYLISLSATVEENEPEIRKNPTPCASHAPPSCPCATCRDDTEEAVFWTNASYTLATWPSGTRPYSFDFSSVSLTAKPSIPTDTPDGITERCLSGYLENAFLRVAAREADISARVGYEYAAFQALGNYVQWPATQWCTESYDPRFRSWYVSAASGPKDVVIVLDVSGSMGQANRMEIMRRAADRLLRTLTDADYVGVVKFSSRAEVALDRTRLMRASEANLAGLRAWVSGLTQGGTTNFVDAFNAALGLFEASGSDYSSGCTKAILFLSDGEPDADPDSADIRRRADALGGVQVFTYALGSGARREALKAVSCANQGALWSVPDGGNLGDAMADYYTFLSPLQSPCQVRWTYYNDYNTGVPLLAACLATFKKESLLDATSCGGGTAGCMPELLGVACMDVSLIATLDQIRARPDAQTFFDRVRTDQTACVRVLPSEAQLQALRARISADYGDAMCRSGDAPGVTDVAAASCAAGAGVNSTTNAPPPSTPPSPGSNVGAMVGIGIAAVGGVLALCCAGYACCRPKKPPPPPQPQRNFRPSTSTSSASQVSAAPPPVVHAQPANYYPQPPIVSAQPVAVGVPVA